MMKAFGGYIWCAELVRRALISYTSRNFEHKTLDPSDKTAQQCLS